MYIPLIQKNEIFKYFNLEETVYQQNISKYCVNPKITVKFSHFSIIK